MILETYIPLNSSKTLFYAIQENVRLRREHTLLNRQLEAFNAHMAEQQQKEVEKQKEKPRKKQKKRA